MYVYAVPVHKYTVASAGTQHHGIAVDGIVQAVGLSQNSQCLDDVTRGQRTREAVGDDAALRLYAYAVSLLKRQQHMVERLVLEVQLAVHPRLHVANGIGRLHGDAA